MPGCLMPADIRSIHKMLAMTSLSVARPSPEQCRRTPDDRPTGLRDDGLLGCAGPDARMPASAGPNNFHAGTPGRNPTVHTTFLSSHIDAPLRGLASMTPADPASKEFDAILSVCRLRGSFRTPAGRPIGLLSPVARPDG